MSILTHDVILDEIARGRIRIDPFHPGSVGPASVDLHLDRHFRVFRDVASVVAVTDDVDYHTVTTAIEADAVLVAPGRSVLGVTRESITLPDDICGWLEGRSRFARLGIAVHVTASFMQPGIRNHQVLEISNLSPLTLELHAGTSICQFIFQRAEGRAHYRGRFADQETP